MDQYIDIKVRVWRQAGPKAQGHFETYDLKHVFQGASFLEMIDILNEQLVAEHKDPVTYDHGVSAVCARCTSTVTRTDLTALSRPASSTCVSSKTARPSPWSLGVAVRSL